MKAVKVKKTSFKKQKSYLKTRNKEEHKFR